MDKHVELSKLCQIRAGLVLSRKVARLNDPIIQTYKVLTLKSIEDGWINIRELDKFDSNEVLDDRYLTELNDVVIRLSAPYTSVQITADLVGLVVPSLFGIVKVDTRLIDAGYLSFILNTEIIQQTYLKNSMGTNIPVIRMQSLRDTKIPLYSMEKQIIIDRINDLMIREKRLQQKLILEKEKYNKEISNQIIKGGNKYGK